MESIYHFFLFHAYDVQKRGGSQLLFLGHLQIKRTYMKVCKKWFFFPTSAQTWNQGWRHARTAEEAKTKTS